MKVELMTGERLEPLGKNMKIIVSDDHTFGTDAILLASFANVRSSDKVCDLGTGCGIIPLIWCKNGAENITAVEIQKKACFQAERSAILNSVNDRLKIINADLRVLRGVLPLGTFDVVTMNPPYKPVGTGIESASEADKIARHETMCSIDDAVAAASSLLRFGGRFCLCHRPERLCDIICSMRKGKIEVKRIRFVSQYQDRAPWLVLVEGKRGAKSHVTVEKNLVIKNPDGSNTDELREIFGDYMDGH